MRQHDASSLLRRMMSKNKLYKSLIGKGFNNVHVPSPLKRYVLENPKWYTPYSPYQAEISQGRLECLYNFQTMIQELTAMPLANASMLDLGSTAAEVCAISNAYHKNKRNTFYVSDKMHRYILDILETKCDVLNLKLKVQCPTTFHIDDDTLGMMIQYPDTYGDIHIPSDIIADANHNNSIVSCATDPLSLIKLKPPGEIGADIAFGTSQRLGVPMYFGGPHASYLAMDEKLLRYMPGRIVGKTKDVQGNQCYRLSLQSREQHIRKEKAVSNICTAQALLANISTLYGVYHGKKGLSDIADTIQTITNFWTYLLTKANFTVINDNFFDTITIDDENAPLLYELFLEKGFVPFFDFDEPTKLSFSFDETITYEDLEQMINIIKRYVKYYNSSNSQNLDLCKKSTETDDMNRLIVESCSIPHINSCKYVRKSPFLSSSIFEKGMTETEFMRYVYHLADKDYSLVNGMVPLGSCTMKLNAAVQLDPLSWDSVANIHPFFPAELINGYSELIEYIGKDLKNITGFEHASFHSNSGAMGEYTALLCIRKYHKERNEPQRNICLLPTSAHGTNFASASLAGMKIVKFDDSIFDNIDTFNSFCEKYRDNLAVMMVTYPNTNGKFQKNMKQLSKCIHENGGLVYLDGANMNALAGITTPAELGADVCHLNLHKTFCIPHGGGGPGMGPIFCNDKLGKYLPCHRYQGSGMIKQSIGTITSSLWSSASLLTIPFLYFRELNQYGIKKATRTAIKNANYMKDQLTGYYKTSTGEVAHEFIIDLNEFKSIGITEVDIAKRLIDYSFHPPTMSWPQKGTLMIEPTESESKEEMDRFIRAMICIRDEINTMPELLKNAPHPISLTSEKEWEFPYTMKRAFYPLSELKKNKFWPSISRVNDVYGDQLFYKKTN